MDGGLYFLKLLHHDILLSLIDYYLYTTTMIITIIAKNKKKQILVYLQQTRSWMNNLYSMFLITLSVIDQLEI
jgi:cellulose synthase/poly-beta-1,6-N-acetylglucosamine synthase-like glycosyltransferase